MKRLALSAAALLVSACATTPPAPKPAEMILGLWHCEVPIQDGLIGKTDITYAANGTTSFTLAVNGSGGGMAMELAGTGTGTWKLLENDTKLETGIGAVQVSSAKVNGNVLQPAMIQPMADQMLANQTVSGAVSITPTSMTLTPAQGSPTTCTR
jgi:hypothetical protein